MKRKIKSVLGRLLFTSGYHRRLLRGRGLVVLFHRVDDRLAGNPISTTIRDFESFCAFFARYFEVIPFGEMVGRAEAGRDLSGALAITFDDGYRDNAITAAPILLRFGLPACFFIATDFIGTDRVPWWDQELGIRSEWMTWDDVRGLRDAGFEIGAHTRNHIDLGRVHGREAEVEIQGARDRLHDELGFRIDLFSYPYGRAEQITDANRELVRKLGFRCCSSAFGGTVRNGDSPFSMRRTPISPWYASPWQLGFEVAALGD